MYTLVPQVTIEALNTANRDLVRHQSTLQALQIDLAQVGARVL